MDDAVIPWAFGGTRIARDHSLTHSILINLSQIKHFTLTAVT